MMRRSLITGAALGVAIFAAGVSHGAGNQAETKAAARSYADACATCHDRGGFAVRVLADRLGADAALIHQRNSLSPQVIRAVVRNGMGAMPAMSRIEVSDAELDSIIAHLMRASPQEQAGGDAR